MIHFGTGGWRAVIADEFTKANIRLLIAGLCSLMHKEGHDGAEICVGYDRRFLSKESAHWAAEVMAGYGFRPYVINRSSPTPLMMFMVKKRVMPYGIAVTASHNPAIYNGIKVFTAGGRDADRTVTDKIESEIAQIDPDKIQSEIIHDRHDTLFGGKLPAPNEDTLGPLAAVVMDRYRCDLGIATDGDADRLGVIDDQGQFVHPNKLLVLLYYYLVKYRGWQGPCVRNNSTTVLLDRVAAGLGQKCYEVPVGFKWVSAKMTETNAIIGGESSGGLAVRGHISGKDGIYAAALLVEMLAVTGKKLSALYREIEAQYGALSYAEASFTMTPARKLALQQYLFEQHACPEFECVDHISREDGCKVYFTDGSWVICRFSGTEPLLRMAAEAETDEKAQSYIRTWKAFLSL